MANEIEIRELLRPVEQRIDAGFEMLQRVLHGMREEQRIMSTSIVTRDQFDQALAAAVTTIKAKLDDLAAKVAAGTVSTPEDFSAELATLQSAVTEALTVDPNPPAPASGDGSTQAATS